MRDQVTLTITSVLSTLLFALHWVDEISRGLEGAKLANLPGVAILVVWLCGPLVLGNRRSGYIVMLVGAILGVGVLVLHMSGGGLLRGRIANTSGIYFWVLTLIALGTTSAISGILAARELWRSFQYPAAPASVSRGSAAP
jgi:hypothetical protein